MSELSSLKDEWSVIVIGAGPAGLAAATVLAEAGADPLLIDEQAEPGGQIYRGVERASGRGDAAALGPEYLYGAELVARFRASGARYAPQATVWRVSDDRRVYVSAAGASRVFKAGAVIIATGAMERPVPLPGWTLPGVMSAGALQILLKTSIVPKEPVIIAGTGPLFYLLAQQLSAAGIDIAAVVDTRPMSNLFAALLRLPAALRGEGINYLFKGIGMVRAARRANYFAGVSNLRIEGEERVEALSFKTNGKTVRLATAIVALHEGVIPSQQMTRAIGCAHRWDDAQRAFGPVCDEWGNSSVPGILVAGDGARVVGARAAEFGGRLAALEAMRHIGWIDGAARDRAAKADRHGFIRHISIRPFLDHLFTPSEAVLGPQGDVVVCRCEEVNAQAIRDLAGDGLGPNQIKSFLRCGMGPCQGRLCGPVVSQIVADERGCSLEKAGYYNVRTPLKPLMLGELAALHDGT